MTYQEIIHALNKGLKVHWRNERYQVVKYGNAQEYWNLCNVIDVYNGYCTSLTESDLPDCFIGESNNAQD